MKIEPKINRMALEKLGEHFEIIEIIEDKDSEFEGKAIVKLRYKEKVFFSTLTLYMRQNWNPELPNLYHEVIFPGDIYKEDELLRIMNTIMFRSQKANVSIGEGFMVKAVTLYSDVIHDCRNLAFTSTSSKGLPNVKLILPDSEVEWIYAFPVNDKTYRDMMNGKIECF